MKTKFIKLTDESYQRLLKIQEIYNEKTLNKTVNKVIMDFEFIIKND